MWNCVSGTRFHGKNILVLSLLVCNGLFLLLQFERCIIQVTPPGIRRSVQPGSSRHEEERGGRSHGRTRDRTYYSDLDRIKMIELGSRKGVNASFSRTREARAERKRPCANKRRKSQNFAKLKEER